MSKLDYSFLGKGWSFPPAFEKITSSVELVSDEEDIRQSLYILLNTRIGERFLNPTYGCDLKDYLFEALTGSLDYYIKDLITTAILYHEPRIRLESIFLRKNTEEGILRIEVSYTIRSTNTRHNYVYPFYLEEGTDIPR